MLERTLGVPIFQEQVMQLAIVAAGFTPGEADQLRRSMAAWKRRGGLGHFEQRLIEGMRARGYDESFAQPDLQPDPGLRRIRLPRIARREFRAAGVQLGVAQVSRARGLHLRAHQQPAHGVLCAGAAGARRARSRRRSAAHQRLQQRLGLHARAPRATTSRRCDWACGWSKVLSEEAAERIVAARVPARSSRACRTSRCARTSRAASSKRWRTRARCASCPGNRHLTFWQVAGSEQELPLAPVPRAAEGTPLLAPPTEGQNIAADYRSPGPHAGAPSAGAAARATSTAAHIVTSADLRDLPHGRVVRVAGIVTARQRPQSAGGVMFITLEDETGYVNLIVWERVWSSARRIASGSRLLEVHGHAAEGRAGHARGGAEAGRSHADARARSSRSHGISGRTRTRRFRWTQHRTSVRRRGFDR